MRSDFPGWAIVPGQISAQPQLARLNQLALRACEVDPSRRFGNAEMLAALTDGEKRQNRPRFAWRGAVTACIAAAAIAAFAFWMRPAAPVAVNFITAPFEAKIFLDGRVQCEANGKYFRTPCTIRDLPARKVHIEFQWDGTEEKLDAGDVDLAENREIKVRRKTGD